MKLSEIRGEDAIEVLAEIIEPVTKILGDPEVAQHKGTGAKAISVALKKHKKDILFILAKLDGENPKTYSPSLASIPMKLLELINDPEMKDLFTPQAQTEKTPSGSATGSTEAKEN